MTFSKDSKVSRRTVLAGAGAGVAAAMAPGGAFAQSNIRPDINSPAGQQMLVLYRTAVGKMKALGAKVGVPGSAPAFNSWAFQAQIHGVLKNPADPVNSGAIYNGTVAMKAYVDLMYGNPPAGSPAAANKAAALAVWGTCPHSSPWFVAWHRWYVYFFESIVRKMSGSQNFMLPYWNYGSNSGPSLQLPIIFTQVGSPLYEGIRGQGFANGQGTGPQNVPMNQGGYMPFTQTTYNPALSAGQFFPSDQAFALPPNPVYMNMGLTGRLEIMPHDMVHNNVGGIMSNVPAAGQDPIFYVHHCQIDRLWASWQSYGLPINWGTGSGSPTQPTQPVWSNKQFVFVDANGKLQTVTAGQAVAGMGISYDNLVKPQPTGGAAAAVAMAATTAPEAAAAAGAKTAQSVAAPSGAAGGMLAEAKGVKVAAGGATLTLGTGRAGSQALGAAGAAPAPDTLTLKGVVTVTRPPAPLHVFVNLPEGQAPDSSLPSHVGLISTFKLPAKGDQPPMGEGHEGHSAGGPDFSFDISQALAATLKGQPPKGEPVKVTITTLGADGKPGDTWVEIESVTLSGGTR